MRVLAFVCPVYGYTEVFRETVGRGTSDMQPSRRVGFGPLHFTVYEMPSLRCYYTLRNTLDFAIHDQSDGWLAALRELFRVRSQPDRGVMSGVAWQAAFFTLNFALRPRNHGAQIRACLRGAWHGITGNLAARY